MFHFVKRKCHSINFISCLGSGVGADVSSASSSGSFEEKLVMQQTKSRKSLTSRPHEARSHTILVTPFLDDRTKQVTNPSLTHPSCVHVTLADVTDSDTHTDLRVTRHEKKRETRGSEKSVPDTEFASQLMLLLLL